MNKLSTHLVSSLEKVMPTKGCNLNNHPYLVGTTGEKISFQLAYYYDGFCEKEQELKYHVLIDSPIQEYVSVRQVRPVPSSFPCYGKTDSYYITTEPGLFPDLLEPMPINNSFKGIQNQWRSLWFDICISSEELTVIANNRKEAGTFSDSSPFSFPLHIEVRDYQNNLIDKHSIDLRIYDFILPKQRLMHTEWLHTDCIANYYNIPVFSEEYWRITENYIRSAYEHGINMILTPIFTPPLDTDIGGERLTVQLLDIYEDEANPNHYHFGFDKLDRWIEICDRIGILYLEIAHFYTQWGAEHAPKIMVHAGDGNLYRKFGWDTDAAGEAYQSFLSDLIPALKKYLADRNRLSTTWFHISDEPFDETMDTYARSQSKVMPLLEDCNVMDATSSFRIYKDGYIRTPVVKIDYIHIFIDNGVTDLWAYHCTDQYLDVPNRFMSMPSARNRILGVLLYYFDIKGFLQWGFNFYNTERSRKAINPFAVTDAGEAFPSGDAFLVYPGEKGEVWESIRGMIVKEAIMDYRYLQLLESKKDMGYVKQIINEVAGMELSFTSYPHDNDFFYRLRERIIGELDITVSQPDHRSLPLS